MSDSDITVIGNLTRDPEYKTLDSGSNLSGFGVAVNERRQNRETKEWEDAPPTFINVVCWNQLADNVQNSLKKGDRVVVKGRLRVRSYEKDDGTKGTSTEVTADEVGVSLRWATTEITKNPKGNGAGSALDGIEEDVLS